MKKHRPPKNGVPAEYEYHLPVLAGEALSQLAVKPDGVYLDATMGGGGHSRLIAERLGEKGLLIALDRDLEAVKRAASWAPPFGSRVRIVKETFSRIPAVLEREGLKKLDGVLLDLGVSSRQLDEGERGFSFMRPGPLDMRMDQSGGPSAADLIATLEEAELLRIFWDFGEEPKARRAVRAILAARERKPVERTEELAEIIERAFGRSSSKHPATRIFQALRIAVNGELAELEQFLSALPGILNPGGRVVVISYHSLEDRLVKNALRNLEPKCICPPLLPQCRCDRPGEFRVLTRKAVRPTEAEESINTRARSAKLRAAMRMIKEDG